MHMYQHKSRRHIKGFMFFGGVSFFLLVANYFLGFYLTLYKDG